MQRHFVMALLQHHGSPCNSSTGGRTPLHNDTCATLSLQGTHFANKATALTLPSEGQVCPQSHRMTTTRPAAAPEHETPVSQDYTRSVSFPLLRDGRELQPTTAVQQAVGRSGLSAIH